MKPCLKIMYGIIRISETEFPDIVINRTKLMKLMYILDRKTAIKSDYPRRLTNINYVNYNYGPYSDELIDQIPKASDRHLFHEFKLEQDNGTVYRYKLCNCPDNRKEIDLNDRHLKEIRDIVEEYGTLETSKLVSTIKLYSEVQDADKYEPIDLSEFY